MFYYGRWVKLNSLLLPFETQHPTEHWYTALPLPKKDTISTCSVLPLFQKSNKIISVREGAYAVTVHLKIVCILASTVKTESWNAVEVFHCKNSVCQGTSLKAFPWLPERFLKLHQQTNCSWNLQSGWPGFWNYPIPHHSSHCKCLCLLVGLSPGNAENEFSSQQWPSLQYSGYRYICICILYIYRYICMYVLSPLSQFEGDLSCSHTKL